MLLCIRAIAKSLGNLSENIERPSVRLRRFGLLQIHEIGVYGTRPGKPRTCIGTISVVEIFNIMIIVSDYSVLICILKK